MARDPFAEASITDVAVIPTPGTPHPVWRTHPPAGKPPVSLTDELQIVRLSRAQVEEYQRACHPANLNFRPVYNASTDAAQATLDVAEALFPGGEVRAVVEDAWREVEVVA